MVIKVNIWQLVDPDLFVDDWTTPVTTPPTISLSSPQSWNYEPGQTVWPVTLNATTTPWTWAPITSVVFREWWSPIHTVPSPQPNWWTEQYIDPTIYSADATFTSTVISGSGTWNSNQVNIRFLNRVYRGFNGNTSIDEAWIEWLNYTQTSSNYPWIYNFTDSILGQYKYFCYPSALWDLDLTPWPNYSIKDSFWFLVPVQKQANVFVTNVYWASIEYNVYRSSNVLWGIAERTII